MDAFCGVCHPVKADASAAGKVALFTSMDETRAVAAAAPSSAAPKAPAAAPAAPAKKK
jgi:hypothetical protein